MTHHTTEFGRLRSIVFDCTNPHALAGFWAPTLGCSRRELTEQDRQWMREQGWERPEDAPSIPIDPPRERGGPTIWFNRVPEGKVAKNRVHIDVNLTDEAEVDDLVARGATILRPLGSVPGEPWLIMADPEGNEFCAFPPE
jgi:hypothetical protein